MDTYIQSQTHLDTHIYTHIHTSILVGQKDCRASPQMPLQEEIGKAHPRSGDVGNFETTLRVVLQQRAVQDSFAFLFPDQPEPLRAFNEHLGVPTISEKELIRACKKIGAAKVFCSGCLSNTAFRIAIQSQPEIFFQTYNTCLFKWIFLVAGSLSCCERSRNHQLIYHPIDSSVSWIG